MKPNNNLVEDEHLHRNESYAHTTVFPDDEGSVLEHNSEGYSEIFYTNQFCYVHSLLTDYCSLLT